MKRKCCHIDGFGTPCDFEAEWWIGADPMRCPDDYTEACTMHVGELLDDAYVHRIYRLEAETSAPYAEVSAGAAL